MSLSVSEFESRIQPKIGDNTGGTVTTSDIIDALNRAKNRMINTHGVYATKDVAVINLFPTVYEYPLPSYYHDFINIQIKGEPRDFSKTTADRFWVDFNDYSDVLAVDANRGSRFLLVKGSGLGASQVVHDCDSLTGNGTWAAEASTDATNVAIEQVNHQVGSGAISFDVDVSQSGNNYAGIENSTMAQVDLTSFANKGTGFVRLYIPSVTNLTGITLRWGNDSSNYYSRTVTTQFNGLPLVAGYNRLGFAWSGATETGSVTDTAIDYINLRVTYSASYTDQAGFILDDIRFENPTRMEIRFYSTLFVVDGDDSSYKTKFESSNDTSMLQEEEDDVLYYFALEEACEIKEMPDLAAKARQDGMEALGMLKTRYTSEKKREVTIYY